MGLKLNKIADDAVQRSLNKLLNDLERRLANPPKSQTPAELDRYYGAVGSDSADVGLMMYQQEKEPKEIRPHLVRASEFLVRQHVSRDRPGADEDRSPWEFERAINLAACFGDARVDAMLSNIQPWQFYHLPDPALEPLVDYLLEVRNYLANRSLNAVALDKLETRCSTETASREERQALIHKVRGLRAVDRQDSSVWNHAIGELVKYHQGEAKHGEYARSRNGFIALPALMLAKLGGDRRMQCTIRSPYLPLKLLEQPL